MFSPLIINTYINQLEALKKDGKQNTRDTEDILDSITLIDLQLNKSLLDNVDFSNSYLLHYIGIYYNIEKDYPKAIEWYTKSANLGNLFAMCSLGCCYDNINDNINSLKWFTTSAKLGYNASLYNLVNYFTYVEKNNKQLFINIFIELINLNITNAIGHFDNIEIDEQDYNYVFDLSQKENNEKTKNILISKLPSLYVYKKYKKENDELKSIKTNGIDKVMITQITKYY